MSKFCLLFLLTSVAAFADPKPQMNQALRSLSDLLPYIAREDKFLDKKNEREIAASLTKLETAFASLKHDQMIKNDLFAPSYALIRQSLAESVKAFKEGNKQFVHWRLAEVTTQCLDCHTRLPESHASKFQEKKLALDPKRYDSLFDLGTAQLIVRDYPAAEKTFLQVIEADLKTKDFMDTADAFRNILLIRTKVRPSFTSMLELTAKYSRNKLLPIDLQEELDEWQGRLKEVQKIKLLQTPLKDDEAVKQLISTFLEPVQKKDDAFIENYDVYLLVSSGLLSRYLFAHPDTRLGPEISYWIGWNERVLKRTYFSNSSDLFFKQCIRRYPQSPVARKCFQELKENAEFEFTGSSGPDLPADVKKELAELEALITKGKP